MLGILRRYDTKCPYEENTIYINGVKFLEIRTHKKVKKALKRFNKMGVKHIATNEIFTDLFLKYNIKAVDHNKVMLDKKIDILKILLKEENNIFVYARTLQKDVLDFIYFLPKICDNIFLDLGNNTHIVQEKILTEYGISSLTNDLNYECQNKMAFYFDKPEKLRMDFLIINLTQEEFDVECISDIECTTPLYDDTNTTDVTAICNALLYYDDNIDVKIKKIKRNA